jgi:hypothetical protein
MTEKSALVGAGWGARPPPFSLLPSRAKLQCTRLLSGKIHSPCLSLQIFLALWSILLKLFFNTKIQKPDNVIIPTFCIWQILITVFGPLYSAGCLTWSLSWALSAPAASRMLRSGDSSRQICLWPSGSPTISRYNNVIIMKLLWRTAVCIYLISS